MLGRRGRSHRLQLERREAIGVVQLFETGGHGPACADWSEYRWRNCLDDLLGELWLRLRCVIGG